MLQLQKTNIAAETSSSITGCEMISFRCRTSWTWSGDTAAYIAVSPLAYCRRCKPSRGIVRLTQCMYSGKWNKRRKCTAIN